MDEPYIVYIEWTDKPHNLQQLCNELQAAGLHWWEPYWDVGDRPEEPGYLRIGYPSNSPPGTEDAIRQVVQNHVPQPPAPPPPTPDQQLKTALQALTNPTANDIKNALLNWLTSKGI